MKIWSLATVCATAAAVFAVQPSARADFSMTLTNCNSSFGCTTPTGNNIATVSVADIAGGVEITVTPTSPFTLVNTGLITFVFSLAQGIGPATVTPITAQFATQIPAGQDDGMGTFQYGLNWTGGN